MNLTDENKCTRCDAHCCRHIAVQIDTPEDRSDCDTIRWYLLHENVWVSIDHHGKWFLEFRTPCKNILPDHRCADYENRPSICREYPGENEYCEKETDELSYTELFTNAEELEKYAKSVFARVKKDGNAVKSSKRK